MKKNNNAVLIIVSFCLSIFLLSKINIVFLDYFPLRHSDTRWYQFITSLFYHANLSHLSGNIFLLYVFGKSLEEERGATVFLITFFISGLCGNLLSMILQPSYIVSMGASGAVFGLFLVTMLSKLLFNWQKILEFIIYGQFVILSLINELKSSNKFDNIDHSAHWGGAIGGIILIIIFQYTKKYKLIK